MGLHVALIQPQMRITECYMYGECADYDTELLRHVAWVF